MSPPEEVRVDSRLSPAEPPIFWQWYLIFLRDLLLCCFHLFSRNDVKLGPGPMECHGWVLEWTYLR